MILGVDLFDCSQTARMATESDVRGMLLGIVELTDMQVIRPPHVLTYTAENQLDSGVTGDVIIAESHIAIHTWPMRGYAHVLVDSCRDFDAEGVSRYVQEQLGAQRVKAGTLDLGLYSALRAGELAEV